MNAHPFQPTPEPWVIESCPANAPATLIIGNQTEGQSVAIVTGDPNLPHVQSNARLLAAAPRMLRFIRYCYGDVGLGGELTGEDMDELRAILRELEGGAR